MPAFAIWLGALLAYAGFRLWYDNWRGRLRSDEIDRFIEALRGTPGAEVNDLDTIRSFLAADDGREFYMLNLVKLASGPVPHPETGTPTRAGELMHAYARGFLSVALRHAGHPALQAAKIGGYVDAWNVPPDPGWTIAALTRYRSRRDMAELATDPRFTATHPFKLAAIPVTASFPTAPGFTLLVGPRIWVGLVLALGAALLQLAVSG